MQVFLHVGGKKIELKSIVADFKLGELLVTVDSLALKALAKSTLFLRGLTQFLDTKGLNTLGDEDGEELRWSHDPLRKQTLVFDASHPFLKSWYGKVRKYDLLAKTKETMQTQINAKSRLLAMSEKQEKLDINGDGKIDGSDLKKVREGQLASSEVSAAYAKPKLAKFLKSLGIPDAANLASTFKISKAGDNKTYTGTDMKISGDAQAQADQILTKHFGKGKNFVWSYKGGSISMADGKRSGTVTITLKEKV